MKIRLPWLCLAALVIVTSQLIDEPPSVGDAGPRVGAWLALGAVALMALGAFLSYARLSVALRVDRDSRPADRSAPADVRPAEPIHHTGRSETTTRVLGHSDPAAAPPADPTGSRRSDPPRS